MPEDLSADWAPGDIPLAATAVVKRAEGFSATPYDDNGSRPGGTMTIGYGTIVDANGQPVTEDTPAVTEDEAERLLLRDMAWAARDVAKRVRVALLAREAAALISWTYNLGDGALGSSTLLKVLNAGDKGAVPSEMRKWIHQGPDALVGLLRRRWAEAAMFVGVDPASACDRAWAEIAALGDWPAFGV